jgi:3-keto steroid reductase
MLLQRRVVLRSEILNLSSILSVQRLARKFLREKELKAIDVVICNAGIGGWTGIDWPHAVWSVLTDWVQAVTHPPFKIGAVGLLTERQTPISGQKGQTRDDESEPPLGEVFCANLFGHYLLVHYLTPLLSTYDDVSLHRSRIVWVSSIEAYDDSLSLDDLQGLQTATSYESSKRLTDLLVLTSESPSTAKYTSRFLGPSSLMETHPYMNRPIGPEKPKQYLCQPGIFASAIIVLPSIILEWAMILAMYIARWLGSSWHTVSTYKGATAPVWLSLADQRLLDAMEINEGKAKWGSSTDRAGNEKVERTEVPGWGWGGRDGELVRRHGRKRDAKAATREDREYFEAVGMKAWAAMEELRTQWEDRLQYVDLDV